MGYRMVLWPVPSLHVANKAQRRLFEIIKPDGSTQPMLDMKTRAELYATIRLDEYEALDASIVKTIIPQATIKLPTTSVG